MDKREVLGGILVPLALVLLAAFSAFFLSGWISRAMQHNQDRQQVEQWPQRRYIDDHEMRLQKLERDLWNRENERLMEKFKMFGDK